MNIFNRRKNKLENRFHNIMEMARDIAQENPNGLHDLIRALLRPIQSEHLIAVAEVEQHTAPPAIAGPSFFFNCFEVIQLDQYWVEPTPLVEISLAKDIVLATGWERRRYCSALAHIGTKKKLGAWRQDPNHVISVWLPWRIAFVCGGNHSITAGILAGEGQLKANEVFDLSPVFDLVACNGQTYINQKTKESIAPVDDYRKAAVFEIGRLIKDSTFMHNA